MPWSHWISCEFFLITLAICLAIVTWIYFYNNPMRHGPWFLSRRFINWFPLGMTYAFLYMGRYNLTVAKNAFGDLMSNDAFGLIFAAGTGLYAFSFLINGPLVDRIGDLHRHHLAAPRDGEADGAVARLAHAHAFFGHLDAMIDGVAQDVEQRRRRRDGDKLRQFAGARLRLGQLAMRLLDRAGLAFDDPLGLTAADMVERLPPAPVPSGRS
jgi:hypothetical protein